MNPGNVSPIDVAAIVQGLMLKEQLPLERLQRFEKHQEVEVSAYGQLQNLLQTFQNNMGSLGEAFNDINFQIISSDPNTVTAQITDNKIAPVTHVINVNQLAQAESQISAPQASNNSALGITDSLNLTVGSTSFSMDINATDSLQNIRDAINNAPDNNQVTASILSSTNSDGHAQYQLVISSDKTGAANAVSISSSAGELNFTEQTQGQDALFTFDGQTVDRASNNIDDVLDGLSFNLLSASNSDVTISILNSDPGGQNDNVVTAMKTLLDSYNDIMSFIDKMQVNPQARNDVFPLLRMELQNLMSASFTGTGPYQCLADIGIVPKQNVEQTATITITDKDGQEMQKEVKYTSTGQLMLSTDVPNVSQYLPSLMDALNNNFSAVQNMLMNSQNGLLTTISNNIDPVTGSISQSIKNSTNLATQSEQIYKQKIIDEKLRLDHVEANLTRKYADLNVLLERLQATNDYVTKQLNMINDESKWND